MQPFDYLAELEARYPQLKPCRASIQEGARLLCTTFQRSGKLLTAGNGGSAADADHIAGELLKAFKHPKPPTDMPPHLASHLQQALPVIPLPNLQAAYTAFSNDCDPQWAFAQLVYALGAKGDAVWLLSTSGNSQNICWAAEVARAKGVHVLGLSGNTGGALKELCDVCICVPESDTPKIQELHMPIYHALCLEVEQAIYSSHS